MNGIDPIVEKTILGAKDRRKWKPERVALAAALCPEILGEKKVWTRNPRSLVEAEKMGIQCGRSILQIKIPLVAWARDVGPYAAMKALASWDTMLTAWVGAAIASRVEKHTGSYEKTIRAAIEDLRAVVRRGFVEDSGPQPTEKERLYRLEWKIQEEISGLYGLAEEAATEDEALMYRGEGIAMIPTKSSIALLTEKPKTTGATASGNQIVGVAWRTLRDLEKMGDSAMETELGEVISNAIMSYPAIYTGSGRASFSSRASLVPAAVVGAILGAGAMHLVKR